MPARYESLDFLYMPSADVATDIEHFTTAFGAEVVFAIEAFGTRVAMLRLSEREPALLFAGHLAGERPILVYRVDDLDAVIAGLGLECERFEIPHGPGCAFETPGGHRIALYQLTRPGVADRFRGRRDF
jgi:hypothetical protein